MGKKNRYEKKGNQYVPTAPNQWRSEAGVKEPLRIGRGIRTRDEFLFEQKNKDIHPEIDKDELYRRGVVLDIDDDENLAIVKTHNAASLQYPEIPNDSQRRKYEVNVHTVSGKHSECAPIHIQQGRFELAPSSENVSVEQAKKMSSYIKKISPRNGKRLEEFRKK